jgi:hypothetical protein
MMGGMDWFSDDFFKPKQYDWKRYSRKVNISVPKKDEDLEAWKAFWQKYRALQVFCREETEKRNKIMYAYFFVENPKPIYHHGDPI